MIKKIFQKISAEILSILFPVECFGCGKENAYLCKDCLNSIELHKTIEPFDHPLQYLDGVFTATDYQNELIQKAIHRFKFRYIKNLASSLSYLLIRYWQNINHYYSSILNPDIIIPVPLHKKRLLERGFNQAELLAKNFAEHFGFQLMTDVIQRCRHTAHQVGLSKEQRIKNIKQAFKVIKLDFIKNKNIILIDDVVTTGSTLEEMAKVLKENGANKIYGLIVAKD